MDPTPLSNLRTEGHQELTADLTFLSGGGEMRQLIRAFDWADTSIGPAERWSPALRSTVSLMLANRFPLLLWWGPQYVSIYNDAYAPILGTKHPKALGQPVRDCWNEIWHILQPLIDSPFHGGTPTWIEDLMMEVNRHGYLEEGHWTVAYSPVPDESVPSGIGGVLATVHEITEKVVAERRVSVLRDLAARATESKTAEDACTIAAETLARHAKDIPFALLYLIDAEGKCARLAGRAGFAATGGMSPPVIDLKTDGNDRSWPLATALRMRSLYVLDRLRDEWDEVPRGPWSDAPRQAVIVPIRSNIAHRPAGVLVAGVSARLKLDEQYKDFYELVAGQIATAIANARAYEEERKRAEALAELDRAKTAFFSNVSHEFRTPLTLMLSPLEELKAQFGRSGSSLDARQYQQVELVHRNGLRLLKLVNTLLDFSRIEAGRAQALYTETDLAAFTTELASVFRSIIEKAGLALIVNCPPLSEPVFVDRDMWEKIVLNLLSNAFKFTWVGEIEVSLQEENCLSRASGDKTDRTDQTDTRHVILSIRDTGTGIPEGQLGKIFERFHRVAGSQGRTFEGTGIGLSFVRELARLHGGWVSVESVYGKGSTFRVVIPLGKSHLPQAHIGAAPDKTAMSMGATPFVEEAARWLPEDSEPSTVNSGEKFSQDLPLPTMHSSPFTMHVPRARVLLADDNADMRDYVRRLLSGQGYEVESVADGQAALDRAQSNPPDIVLTDVMMPRLDGFMLLRALRDDPATKTIPVILLSARAGEESRVEGLEHGADDYLIKPFNARELLARVETHVKLARMRRDAEVALRESEAHFRNLADTAPAMLWVTEPNGSCTFLSRGWYDFTGQNEEEAIRKQGFGWLDAVHPEDREKAEHIFMEANKAHRPFSLDYRLRRHDGEYRWVIDAGRPRFGSDGKFLGYIGSVFDITDRKQAEEALRTSEEQFRAVFDQTTGGIAQTDLTGRFILVNDRYCDIVGRSREELLTLRMHDITHPDDVLAHVEKFHALAEGGSNFIVEKRYLRPDGSIVWVHTDVAAVRDSRGQVSHAVAIVVDISERKRAEQSIRESEERFRAFINATSDVVYRMSPDWTEMRHLQGREFIADTLEPNQTWLNKYIHAVDQRHVLEAIQRAVHSKSVFELEHRVIRVDGSLGWTHSRAIPILDDRGEIVEWFGAASDVTQRKEVVEELAEQERVLKSVTDNASVAMFIMDEHQHCVFMNPAAETLSGFTLEQLRGRPLHEFIHHTRPDGRPYPREECPIDQAFPSDNRIQGEEIFIHPDGRFYHVAFTASPIPGPGRQPIGTIIEVQDITERKALENRLRSFTNELEAQVEERTRDLVQSQDRLRTLATELNLAEQRERQRLATELHDYLAQLLVLGRLTLGQAKRTGLPPRGEEFVKETEEILNKALTYCRTLMAELSPPVLRDQGLAAGLKWLGEYMKKHLIAVTVTVPEKNELRLSEDQAVLLFQSVRELLMNACKHAGTGEAAVVLEQTGDTLQITVSDQGSGFDFAAAAAAADNASPLSSKYGLFSIRERMKALGGSFDIRSAIGQGTTVTLTLPIVGGASVRTEEAGLWTESSGQAVSHHVSEVSSRSSHSALNTQSSVLKKNAPIRVLLVDDHPMMRQGLRSIVTAYDHLEIVGEAGDGREAVELAQRLDPDVVVMDINMPEMDGIEATQRIKANQPTTVVIGLSVNQSADTEQKMKTAGAFTYLTKESAVDALCHAIEQAVSYKQQRQTARGCSSHQ